MIMGANKKKKKTSPLCPSQGKKLSLELQVTAHVHKARSIQLKLSNPGLAPPKDFS